uniref:Ig-like domain-containing protein n=1 Tax=Periophthalmus magnuspinnatus TaxID=409849 RepID=A0A3B3ZXC7_9GOBI
MEAQATFVGLVAPIVTQHGDYPNKPTQKKQVVIRKLQCMNLSNALKRFLFAVSLRVFPNRLQFFQYDSVSLSCEDQTNASEWTIMRNTSFHKNEKNSAQNKSNWVFNSNLYYNDAGVYWCQSERGECGAVVNINCDVPHTGHVILESPSLPVKEGETVTLRCLFNPRKKTRTEGTFVFFKDGDCVRNSTGGDLTIHNVAHSDSGLYTCSHQGELSLGSTLEVLKTGQ